MTENNTQTTPPRQPGGCAPPQPEQMSCADAPEILFHVLAGGSKYIEQHPCLDLVPVLNDDGTHRCLKTRNAVWFRDAAIARAVEKIIDKDQIESVTVVCGALDSDPKMFRLSVTIGGERRIIELGEAEIFSYSKYKLKVAAVFKVILPDIKKSLWEAILAPVLQEAEYIHDESNETPVVLDVQNFMESADVVSKKEELVTGAGKKVWVDKSEDVIYVLGRDFEPIAEKYHIEMRRLSALLERYRVRDAKRERIAGRRYYLWAFDPRHFNLKNGGTP